MDMIAVLLCYCEENTCKTNNMTGYSLMTA